MTAYYNEIDPYAAQWLRNLIDAGHIAPGYVETEMLKGLAAQGILDRERLSRRTPMARLGLPEGAVIEVTDRAGNSSSSPVTVTLDTTPPSVLITSPSNGATLSASPVTVTGTAGAVTRKGWDGKTWGANQKISVSEAIRVNTYNGAWASFEEPLKGSITAGKLADYVVLADDPHTVDVEKIKDITIVRTVVGGAVSYQA